MPEPTEPIAHARSVLYCNPYRDPTARDCSADGGSAWSLTQVLHVAWFHETGGRTVVKTTTHDMVGVGSGQK